MKKLLLLFALLIGFSLSFAQQNDEFKYVTDYYNKQRVLLNTEFKKRFDKEKLTFKKIVIKNDFKEFMTKLDSIENTALTAALIAVKNREDLSSIKMSKKGYSFPNHISIQNANAKYPGGIDQFRQDIVQHFYTEGVLKTNDSIMKTNVDFVVERDGTISNVIAKGPSSTFNMQAEIAVYKLPYKFEPATYNGQKVIVRFRLPLAMKIN